MSADEPRSLEERCATCGRDAQVHPFHSFLQFRSAAEKTKAGSRSARETADMAPPNPERDHASMRDGDTPHASASNRADPNPPPSEPATAEATGCSFDARDYGIWCQTHGDYLVREVGSRTCYTVVVARLRAENAGLRAEIEQLVAELIREHDEAESYRQDRTRMVRSRERCRTCALVDEARRTIGGEDGA